ncbi:catalase-related domain-containing protein [Ectobacillus ponti]|uniref:Catalase immune-responsive domain-containing protein n=1 Tax=Ectobacillus ponti TaxID=2961894 RepID=A0AA42BPU1_9BACI|nr:catalase-related domain-containing protein [Ectobacillus ponti]MCP8969535.1 hypothetical protein [Ectobacillus ponti]
MSDLTTNQGAPSFSENYYSLKRLDQSSHNSMWQENDFEEVGGKYRSLSEEERTQLISGLAADLAGAAERTKLLGICNFYRADVECGQRLAAALNVDLAAFFQQMRM